MNERIKELALRAGLYHKVSDNNFYPTYLSAEQSDPTYQKFAELIVEGMYDFIMEESASDNGIPDLGKVKQYFGVEE